MISHIRKDLEVRLEDEGIIANEVVDHFKSLLGESIDYFFGLSTFT